MSISFIFIALSIFFSSALIAATTTNQSPLNAMRQASIESREDKLACQRFFDGIKEISGRDYLKGNAQSWPDLTKETAMKMLQRVPDYPGIPKASQRVFQIFSNSKFETLSAQQQKELLSAIGEAEQCFYLNAYSLIRDILQSAPSLAASASEKDKMKSAALGFIKNLSVPTYLTVGLVQVELLGHLSQLGFFPKGFDVEVEKLHKKGVAFKSEVQEYSRKNVSSDDDYKSYLNSMKMEQRYAATLRRDILALLKRLESYH